MNWTSQLLTIAVVLYLFVACSPQSRDGKQITTVRKSEQDQFYKRSIVYRTDSRKMVDVTYVSADSMVVRQINGADTSSVNIRGPFNSDSITLCDSCLFVREQDKSRICSGLYTNDSLFLLPVVGSGWHILLFGIDFRSKQVALKKNALAGDYLETYLDAFVFNAQTQHIICADSFDEYDENLNIKGIKTHTYKIDALNFIYDRSSRIHTPVDIRTNPSAMKKILEKLSK